jgi:hypothetical protein
MRCNSRGSAWCSEHDSLRASFLWHELEEPLQLVWRDVALAWSVVDLVGVDKSARDTTIESFLRATVRAAFSSTARR